jgi:hypothetical protein
MTTKIPKNLSNDQNNPKITKIVKKKKKKKKTLKKKNGQNVHKTPK